MVRYCVSPLLAGLGLFGILVGSLTVGLYPRLYDYIMKKVRPNKANKLARLEN